MPTDELEQLINRYHETLDIFVTGDAGAAKELWSRGDDVTLANPLGPPVRGWAAVDSTTDAAAAQFRDGEPCRFEEISRYVTAHLAYNVEIERTRAKVAGSDDLRPIALRVTTIFRREEDGWKVVHRHADPLTEPRSAEAIVQQ